MQPEEDGQKPEDFLCAQCDRKGIVPTDVGGLCIDCFHKLEVAKTLAFRLHAIGYNIAVAEMDSIAPFGMPSPRMQVPEIPRGPLVMHNFTINQSTIGAINTGTVGSIDVSITTLKQKGSDQLAEALKALTEAVLQSDLAEAERSQLLDQTAYLSEQALLAKEKQRPGMIKAAIEALGTAASTVKNLAAAWAVAKPILTAVFL